MPSEIDNRQAKLTSIDYLLALLRKLEIYPEVKCMKVFQHYRYELFYKGHKASGLLHLRIEK